MSDREDSDSDAPEEFTALQGIQQDEEIRKIQKESKASYKSKESKDTAQAEDDDVSGSEPQHNPNPASGFLPDDVVKMLAAREKQAFLPYYEGEEEKAKTKPAASKKRKSKKSGYFLSKIIYSNNGLQFGTCYFERTRPSSMFTGCLRILEEKKNVNPEIVLCLE
ncbi:hypothetical protein AAHE18_03G037500 [Arachis hypogaea]